MLDALRPNLGGPLKPTAYTLLTFFVVALSAQLSLAATSTGKIHWLTPDFFVEEGMQPGQGRTLEGLDPATQDCRATIAVKTCLVDPRTGSNDQNRTCLDGSRGYAKPLEDVYDHLPPAFQKMFCSIRTIYIEKQYGATAYAGSTSKGPIIGIRQSVLDEGMQFARWASWKEQLAFGGVKDSYTPVETLPFYVTPPLAEVNTFLYQLLVHEFGHQFDFANGLNAFQPGCEEGQECGAKQGSWSALSWATNSRPLPENDFVNRDKFCFYSCGTNTSPLTIVPALYSDLYNSAFINAYAATGPWDDFADSMAYYAISTYLHTSIQLDTAQGQVYDLTGKLYTERFAKKLKYIEDFLARTDIRYP